MANAYGTKKYNEYIQGYLSSFDFDKVDEECFVFSGLKATAAHYEYWEKTVGYYKHAEKTVVTITDKNNAPHVYECIDAFFTPYEFEHNGSKYLLFRKSLYGYTILNLTDFSEINYFPSDVLDGREAFIICEAKIFKTVLVLGGCFWAGPYECYALDLASLKTANISAPHGINDVADGGITISADTLVLHGSDNEICKIEYATLLKTIGAENNYDM